MSTSAGTPWKMGGGGTLGASGSYSGAITNDGTLHIDSIVDQVLSGAIGGAGQLIAEQRHLSLSTGNSYGAAPHPRRHHQLEQQQRPECRNCHPE
ncbi:MAG: hypothetical protein U1F87_09440 [Kiritimatiellia bacterium]